MKERHLFEFTGKGYDMDLINIGYSDHYNPRDNSTAAVYSIHVMNPTETTDNEFNLKYVKYLPCNVDSRSGLQTIRKLLDFYEEECLNK